MIRLINSAEINTVLAWHFKHVDSSIGGRGEYARKFPKRYNQAVNTIKGNNGFVLVADVDDSIVGYLGVRIDTIDAPNTAYLCGFWVDPNHRRRGYGRALAEKSIEMLRTRSVDSLSVEVGLQKPWLIEFYESVGFKSSSMSMYQAL